MIKLYYEGEEKGRITRKGGERQDGE